jgi:hypothetical protein
MKNLMWVIVAIVVIAIIWWAVAAHNNNTSSVSMTDTNHTGSLYVGVTDASADIKNVDDINLSVKKVEVYNASQGWVTVSSNSKNYDLLTLKNSGEVKLYAKDDLDSGTYSKVRVTLGDANIKTKTKGTVRATLPASQIVMNENVKINDGQTSHLKLDFLADKSLHSTSDGKFVFAPVVNSEARSNTQVTSGDNEVITTSGGTVDDDVAVGVDLAGSSRPNFQLTSDNTLQIKSSSGGVVNFILGGKTFTADDNIDKEDEGQVNTDTSGSLNLNGALNGNINSNTSTNSNTNTNTNSSGSGASANGSGTLNLGY